MVLAAAACPGPGPRPGPTADQLVGAGLVAEEAGNTSQAFTDFQAAARDDPKNRYAPYDLGELYQIRGEGAVAAAEYLDSLRIDPRFPQALYNMGVLESKADPTDAIAYYLRFLEVDPGNPAGNFNLGVLLVERGQMVVGEMYLARAIHAEPNLARSLPKGITLSAIPAPETSKP